MMLFEQPPLPHPGADRPFTPHPTPTPNPSPPQPTRPSSPTSAFTAFLLTSPFRPDERALWRLILRALADDDPVTLRSHLDAADPIAAIHVLLACSHQNGPTSPGGSGHYSFDPELIPESTKLLGAAIGPLNAVQLACMAGAEDCALQLLEFLATASRDVMRSDRPVHVMMDQEWGEGNTALHLASFNALPQVVTRLLRLGANPNRRNGKGLRPVDCADESCSAAFWEIGEVVTRSKGALTDSASQSDEEDDDEDTDRSDAQGDGSFTEPSDDDDEHTRANEQRAKHHTLATRTKSPLIEPNNKNRENRTKTIESKPVMREIAPVAQGSNITKTGVPETRDAIDNIKPRPDNPTNPNNLPRRSNSDQPSPFQERIPLPSRPFNPNSKPLPSPPALSTSAPDQTSRSTTPTPTQTFGNTLKNLRPPALHLRIPIGSFAPSTDNPTNNSPGFINFSRGPPPRLSPRILDKVAMFGGPVISSPSSSRASSPLPTAVLRRPPTSSPVDPRASSPLPTAVVKRPPLPSPVASRATTPMPTGSVRSRPASALGRIVTSPEPEEGWKCPTPSAVRSLGIGGEGDDKQEVRRSEEVKKSEERGRIPPRRAASNPAVVDTVSVAKIRSALLEKGVAVESETKPKANAVINPKRGNSRDESGRLPAIMEHTVLAPNERASAVAETTKFKPPTVRRETWTAAPRHERDGIDSSLFKRPASAPTPTQPATPATVRSTIPSTTRPTTPVTRPPTPGARTLERGAAQKSPPPTIDANLPSTSSRPPAVPFNSYGGTISRGSPALSTTPTWRTPRAPTPSGTIGPRPRTALGTMTTSPTSYFEIPRSATSFRVPTSASASSSSTSSSSSSSSSNSNTNSNSTSTASLRVLSPETFQQQPTRTTSNSPSYFDLPCSSSPSPVLASAGGGGKIWWGETDAIIATTQKQFATSPVEEKGPGQGRHAQVAGMTRLERAMSGLESVLFHGLRKDGKRTNSNDNVHNNTRINSNSNINTIGNSIFNFTRQQYVSTASISPVLNTASPAYIPTSSARNGEDDDVPSALRLPAAQDPDSPVSRPTSAFRKPHPLPELPASLPSSLKMRVQDTLRQNEWDDDLDSRSNMPSPPAWPDEAPSSLKMRVQNKPRRNAWDDDDSDNRPNLLSPPAWPNGPRQTHSDPCPRRPTSLPINLPVTPSTFLFPSPAPASAPASVPASVSTSAPARRHVDSLLPPSSNHMNTPPVAFIQRSASVPPPLPNTADAPVPRLVRRVSFDPIALLMDASQSGDLAAVRRVFEQFPGTDVNAPLTAKSLTPLHLAASYDHEHIVRYLVEQRGADVNAVDAEGWTAMHCAAAEGFFDVLTFLVAIPEAELERRTDDGEGIEEVSADEAVREKSREIMTRARRMREKSEQLSPTWQ